VKTFTLWRNNSAHAAFVKRLEVPRHLLPVHFHNDLIILLLYRILNKYVRFFEHVCRAYSSQEHHRALGASVFVLPRTGRGDLAVQRLV